MPVVFCASDGCVVCVDLSIVLAESRRMQLSLPGLALAYSLYVALMAQGGGRLGTQALYTALEKLNGIEQPKPKP